MSLAWVAAWLPAWLAGPEAGLTGVFAISLIAATLLPVSSEVVLFAFVALHPAETGTALLLATAGNTLGGMTSYGIGYYLPAQQRLEQLPQIGRVRRWGAPALLLAWLPLIGDALCVAAGWLRLHWLGCLLFMAAGKLVRYWLVVHSAGLAS